MARSEVLSRQTWSEKTDNFGDFSRSNCHDVHVLAVDDSLIDRKVIERLLKITSCKVTVVDSGIRALQYLGLDKLDAEKNSAGFDGLKVDMIITDYCMPGMTGYELLKKIKGSSMFRQVPVVIMSSENVLARIDRCLEEGAEDFIVKPVKLSDVKRLKDYMFGKDESLSQKQETNKRKLSQISSESEISESSFSSSSSSPPPFISDSSTESLSSLLSIDSATTISSSPSPQSSSPSSPSLLTSP